MKKRIDRRAFLAAALGVLSLDAYSKPPSVVAPGFYEWDPFRKWRERQPKPEVDESDPNVFIFSRAKYRTVRITNSDAEWHASPSGDANFLAFLRNHTNVKVSTRSWWDRVVDLSDPQKMYKTPFLFMTGDDNFRFTDEEAVSLREFFKRGGFLYADDCVIENASLFYDAFKKQSQRIMPGVRMRPVPSNHELYTCFYTIPDGRSPYCLGNPNAPDMGLFYNNRLVCLLTAGDVHCGWWGGRSSNVPPRRKHEECLRFGVNVVIYALTH